MLAESVILGVNPSGGHFPFTYAALDPNGFLIILAQGELIDMLDFLERKESALVAVNAPMHPNRGLVRERFKLQGENRTSMRGLDLRLAEYELSNIGISIQNTPSRPELCPSWIQIGFQIYDELIRRNYRVYPSKDHPLQYMETHPYVTYYSLLRQAPLPKPTLEGRLQRQLVLHANGLNIKDPMEFFEEITRHRLLNGILPMDILYTPDELDALAAALTALIAIKNPEDINMVGDVSEGQIVLPTREPILEE